MLLGCMTLAGTCGNGALIGTGRIILRCWQRAALLTILKARLTASILKSRARRSVFRRAGRSFAAIDTARDIWLAAAEGARSTAPDRIPASGARSRQSKRGCSAMVRFDSMTRYARMLIARTVTHGAVITTESS